jgi:putative ABC transport system permease protein
MFKNYFKIAFRNLVKGGWYSTLNIGGLGVVLTVSLLLFWWVKDELSFDRFHADADRIYRVNIHFGKGEDEEYFEDSPAPLGVNAKRTLPEVEATTRFYPFDLAHTFRANGKTLTQKGELSYVDENFLNMFSGLEVLHGDPAQPFPTSSSVVLTEDVAQKFFGTSDAVGKVFRIVERNQTFIVGAVLGNNPDNSSLRTLMYWPMSMRRQDYRKSHPGETFDENWKHNWLTTYVKLVPGADPEAVGKKLTSLKNAVVDPREDGSDYKLQVLKEIHLYSVNYGASPALQQVQMMGLIALFLLGVGCINYVNLTTARGTRRIKEIGIRKAIGAQFKQLSAQLLIESGMTLTLSLILAIILIQTLLPYYSDITGKHGDFSLLDGQALLVLSGSLLLTFLLAGIYPAFLVARFSPISALHGWSNRHSDAGLRKGLVVLQFVLATVLVISTLVIGRQLRYMRELNLGFNREQVFGFYGGKFAAQFKQALANESGVRNVTISSDKPIAVQSATVSADWDGRDPNRAYAIAHISVDKDFIPGFGVKLLAGRNFDGTAADSTHFILNEMAVKQIGLKSPLGRRFKDNGIEGTIIGVVKDFNIASAHEEIRPLILYNNPIENKIVMVRTTGESAAAVIATSEKLWKTYMPAYPFEYSFLDEDYDQLYKGDRQTGHLFSFFAGVAILISCLGLLGLVSYTAEQRTKEVGIRKVLGASVSRIVTLLSIDFLLLVAVAVIIALPVAWYFMKAWLSNFAFKTNLEWWIFALAGISVSVVALATVGFQSIKAALANPVKTLRSE